MLLGLNIIVLKFRYNTFQSNTIQLISFLIKIGHVITDHFFGGRNSCTKDKPDVVGARSIRNELSNW
jgi:hypothetical protein